MLRSFATTAPATARSRSASSKTMNGALPPSSMDVRSTPSAAPARMCRPTGVEPVKETLRSRPSAMRARVTSSGRVVWTRLSTPTGRPASCSTDANRAAVSGVRSAGFRIAVQPAASAAPTLRAAIASGKFQGVMSRLGPTGCLVTSTRDRPSGDGAYRPYVRTASSENHRRNSAL